MNSDISAFDFDSALEFSFDLIKNLPKIWKALDVVDFKALRKILFPENIIYPFINNQTAELCFIYKDASVVQAKNETLVERIDMAGKLVRVFINDNTKKEYLRQ